MMHVITRDAITVTNSEEGVTIVVLRVLIHQHFLNFIP